jgi:hypothetical protein
VPRTRRPYGFSDAGGTFAKGAFGSRRQHTLLTTITAQGTSFTIATRCDFGSRLPDKERRHEVSIFDGD